MTQKQRKYSQKPRICQVITDFSQIKKHTDFIEIRLTHFKTLPTEEEFASINQNLIISIEDTKHADRASTLVLKLLNLNPKIISINAAHFKKMNHLIKRAKEKKIKLMLSSAPSRCFSEKTIVEEILKLSKNADIVKYTPKIESIEENTLLANVCSLLRTKMPQGKHFIVYGRGKKGKVSQIMNSYFGSYMVYGTVSPDLPHMLHFNDAKNIQYYLHL